MKEAVIAFIGVGNMGSALARAASKRVPGERLLLANRTAEKSRRLASELGARAVSNAEAAERGDLLVLGVKPQGLPALLAELAPVLDARRDRPPVLVSIAAGISIARVQELAGHRWPVIALKPNTPCAVGEGMSFYACSPEVSPEAEAAVLDALAASGRLSPLDEAQLDAAGVVAGCGPAFADLFLEALADGAVACGLPRAAAYEAAAQMLLGAAKLALETGTHPGALKDAVCSPGGTTIQGVRALERGGLRGAVMEAVIAAFEKNRSLA
ncbi:MAG: pyrroline-5-carboxylate reductase [Oscillospiraceae bacterium]|nr:pyrroline-5-carboxylate reductase [Oscillospiraceae bacterium]